MEFQYGENKIFLEDENNNIIAEIEYEKLDDNVYNIYHTFVDQSLRGQGIASKLVKLAVEEIIKKGGKVQATCSYAKVWLDRNSK